MKASETVIVWAAAYSKKPTMTKSKLKLPISDETTFKALALKVLSAATNKAKAAINPPRVKSKKGCHNGSRCAIATLMRPTIDEQKVANKMGKKTKVGSVAPCCARYIKIVTGRMVNDELFNTKKSICAFVAVFSCVFNACKECIARKPIGVAALSNPKPLAAKFRVIRPKAG